MVAPPPVYADAATLAAVEVDFFLGVCPICAVVPTSVPFGVITGIASPPRSRSPIAEATALVIPSILLPFLPPVPPLAARLSSLSFALLPLAASSFFPTPLGAFKMSLSKCRGRIGAGGIFGAATPREEDADAEPELLSDEEVR
jgi:hypothetical protein